MNWKINDLGPVLGTIWRFQGFQQPRKIKFNQDVIENKSPYAKDETAGVASMWLRMQRRSLWHVAQTPEKCSLT